MVTNPKLQLVETSLLGYELGSLGEPTTPSEGRLPTQDGEVVASILIQSRATTSATRFEWNQAHEKSPLWGSRLLLESVRCRAHSA